MYGEQQEPCTASREKQRGNTRGVPSIQHPASGQTPAQRTGSKNGCSESRRLGSESAIRQQRREMRQAGIRGKRHQKERGHEGPEKSGPKRSRRAGSLLPRRGIAVGRNQQHCDWHRQQEHHRPQGLKTSTPAEMIDSCLCQQRHHHTPGPRPCHHDRERHTAPVIESFHHCSRKCELCGPVSNYADNEQSRVQPRQRWSLPRQRCESCGENGGAGQNHGTRSVSIYQPSDERRCESHRDCRQRKSR